WVRSARPYSEILDAHGSIRSRLFCIIYRIRSALRLERVQVHRISKQKLRTWGDFLLRKLWPIKPSPWVRRYARLAQGDPHARPDLRGLAATPASSPQKIPQEPYAVVMPSSRWETKQWPVLRYAQVFQHLQILPVILGRSQDEASARLVSLLKGFG